MAIGKGNWQPLGRERDNFQQTRVLNTPPHLKIHSHIRDVKLAKIVTGI